MIAALLGAFRRWRARRELRRFLLREWDWSKNSADAEVRRRYP